MSDATAITFARGDSESSAEAVARYIRRLIIEGDLHADQRLPQDDIAEAVGVSRIPVREAIIALQREGWLRVELHRGAFVNALDDRVIADHYELYGRYFAFAARRAIERASQPEFATLDRLASRAEAVKTPTAFLRANRAFLDALIESAHSHRLRVSLRSMVPVVTGNFFAVVPGATAVQKEGIAGVAEALRARNGQAAEQEFLAVERRQGELVIALLESRAVITRRTRRS